MPLKAVRILGPNCMGLIRPGKNLNAGFASDMPLTGNLAFVSQSGAICGAILDMAAREHMGFSHFVSIGSMLAILTHLLRCCKILKSS